MGMTIERGIPAFTIPGRGRPPRVSRDRKVPLLVLLAAALVLAAVVWGPNLFSPTNLSAATLAGTRQLTGRACVAIANDLSGSMASYAPTRQAVKAALLPWLRNNLHPDDQVAMADFTDEASVVLPATPAARLPVTAPTEVVVGSGGTAVVPAVDVLGAALKGQHCAATALIMITDGKIGDSPDILSKALAERQITRAHVLNPDGGRRPRELDHPGLRAITIVDIRHADADELGLEYGRLIADLTGQDLERK